MSTACPPASVPVSPRGRAHRWRVLVAELALGCAVGLYLVAGHGAPAAPLPARPPVSEADTVIAAYLVNFVRYVEWPAKVPPAEEPWRIGILNSENLRGVLARMVAGKTVRDRGLVVVHATDAAGLHDCQVVLLPAAAAAAAQGFAGRPVLTVAFSDQEKAPAGAMITLLRVGHHIRYRLDSSRLTSEGLRPTAGLLENALAQSPSP
jgi:hypothetical protein